MLSFAQALRLVWARGISFTGRSSRSEYWWFMLASVLLYLVVFLALVILFLFVFNDTAVNGNMTAPSYVLSFVVAAFVFVALFNTAILFCLVVRRLKDIEFSPWLVILTFIPMIGFIYLIVFGVIPSRPNKNRNGLCPTDNIQAHFDYYMGVTNFLVHCSKGVYGNQNGYYDYARNFNGSQQGPFTPLEQYYTGQFNPKAGSNDIVNIKL